MPVVIVSNSHDQSTYKVVRWIDHYNKPSHIINEKQSLFVNSVELSSNNRFVFESDNERIELDDIAAFWHRRGNIRIEFPKIVFPEDFPFQRDFLSHLEDEQRKLKDYINFQFKQKKHLGNIFQTNINKLVVLKKAQNLGISLPATLITSSKKELLKFKSQYKNIICKPISEGLMCHDVEIGLIIYYTNVLSDEDISMLGDTFTASLFQEKIEKKYELRIFFIDNEFYPMAIFSQQDDKTAVDFRKYNYEKPNRTVPYILPVEIKEKLNLLMQELNLNTGSIDMAVSLNNEYLFFEVNPVGQFGMTSYPCNYLLEKKIAEYLITENATPEKFRTTETLH